MSSYSLLDNPQILQNAFFPIKEWSVCPDYATDIFVAVDSGTNVACRFFAASPEYPTILFFHGNGEIASDYDDIAPFFFTRCNANLVVAEFRGYGASGGDPTFSAVISDAHIIFREVCGEISKRGYRNEFWIMGRSMGSVPALELAKHYPKEISGLIIESGFPSATRIARRLGLPIPEADVKLIEDECQQKMRAITVPALIIHGEADSLVSINEAYTLERELGSSEKRLCVIRGADHNSVMAMDITGYFNAIKSIMRKQQDGICNV